VAHRKWYSLYDKVFSPRTLRAAWALVRANRGAAGVDGQTIKAFGLHEEANLLALHEALKAKTYAPSPVRRVWIEKEGGGRRPLGVPTVADRIVQQAARLVLEPIFEAKFLDNSMGFRPGRGALNAVRWIQRALDQGYRWVVDADIKGYFDTIPHDAVLDAVNEEVADGSVLRLLRTWLESGVWEHGEVAETDTGTPQGGVISPLLANIYLHPLDVAFWERLPDVIYVRYADDFVILCRTRAHADRALGTVRHVVEDQLHLKLHPTKTRIVHLDEGFDFLGHHFEREPWRQERDDERYTVRPRDSKAHAFKAEVRRLTRRHQGVSLKAVIARLSRYLYGWGAYFRRCGNYEFFRRLTSWLRHRLRSYATGRWNQFTNWVYPVSRLEALGFPRLRSFKEAARLVPIWVRPLR